MCREIKLDGFDGGGGWIMDSNHVSILEMKWLFLLEEPKRIKQSSEFLSRKVLGTVYWRI